MIFSEIYGDYFNAIAAVLTRAAEGGLTGKELTAIVRETAFGESLLTIPAALTDGRWPLLNADLTSRLRHPPAMPLTTLQKQWLKALLQDPRIRLFAPSEAGLEDTQPLYGPDTFVFYDRYSDGDPFEDEAYIRHFRTILQAMREKKKLRIWFQGSRSTRQCRSCIPYRLEYSAKDDKFRLITSARRKILTINVAGIRVAEMTEPWTEEEYRPLSYRDSSLVMELTDERNGLERVMLHFSDLEKETEKLDERRYRITLWYKKEDETEILIRVLSFGPILKVLEPEEMVRQIRERLERQTALGQ